MYLKFVISILMMIWAVIAQLPDVNNTTEKFWELGPVPYVMFLFMLYLGYQNWQKDNRAKEREKKLDELNEKLIKLVTQTEMTNTILSKQQEDVKDSLEKLTDKINS